MSRDDTYQDVGFCPACKQMRKADSMISGALIPLQIVARIQREHAGWSPDENVCQVCINQAKASYMQKVLEAELEALSPIEHQVLNSIQEGELISTYLYDEIDRDRSRSERLAEQFTAAIGNWFFPIAILALLSMWIGVNILYRSFEPYPVIVMAMISAALASLAALEGPIILMSQRRQAKRDRLRAINDYRLNLKSELEIRYLNEKIDHWLSIPLKTNPEFGIEKLEKSARIDPEPKRTK